MTKGADDFWNVVEKAISEVRRDKLKQLAGAGSLGYEFRIRVPESKVLELSKTYKQFAVECTSRNLVFQENKAGTGGWIIFVEDITITDVEYDKVQGTKTT